MFFSNNLNLGFLLEYALRILASSQKFHYYIMFELGAEVISVLWLKRTKV